MKKLLAILVLGLLLISNIAEAKTKDIGNGLTINIPKNINILKLISKNLRQHSLPLKKC